jgi:uncharacterized membrane protein
MISPVVAPIIVLFISAALFFKLIPRNPLFGLRTPETTSCDEKWYAANRSLGAGGVVGGAAWLVLTVALPRLGMSAGIATVIGIGVAVTTTLIAANRALQK